MGVYDLLKLQFRAKFVRHLYDIKAIKRSQKGVSLKKADKTKTRMDTEKISIHAGFRVFILVDTKGLEPMTSRV
jgi:hypothetical protein